MFPLIVLGLIAIRLTIFHPAGPGRTPEERKEIKRIVSLAKKLSTEKKVLTHSEEKGYNVSR